MTFEPISAESIPESKNKTIYPKPFAGLVEGRTKKKLGDYFGLINFGINLARLEPGAISALFHHHAKQDEFVYILDGTPTLLLGKQEFLLKPGECFGFKAGTGIAHQLINRSQEPVVYIEAGDRSLGDLVEYPNDDLKATQMPNGSWSFAHKDGELY
jgi:uncharacterized cupin superfamily protein